VREKALALAGVKAGKTAADLGAGTGFVTQALLEAGLTVFAVDQSPAMLAELGRKFGPTRRLTALEGSAERLPLPDASVDFAFANMFLHHVDDPRAAIAEMARILRPGGRLVVTDLDSHNHAFLMTEHHDRWPGFKRAEVAAWLADAGLDAVAVDCCGENCCADSCDGADKAAISIFAASAMRPVLGVHPANMDPATVGRRARTLFEAGAMLLCAESVFQAVAEGLGVDSPLVPRVATGFCSGLSRTDGLCGAFTGGVLALGLACGRANGKDDLDETYVPVQAYREFFVSRFGYDACTRICGCRLDTDEGRKAFAPSGAKARCLDVVEQAAGQVARLLQEG